MRECDSAERTIAKGVAGSRFTVQPEEEPGLWINKGMAKAIEHDSGDIALRVEARSSKHFRHLLADSPFVVGERSGQQFRAAQLTLRASWEPRLRKINEERQHRRQIGTRGRRIDAKRRVLAHVDITAEPFEPRGARNRSEEHTSELQSQSNLVCRLLLE